MFIMQTAVDFIADHNDLVFAKNVTETRHGIGTNLSPPPTVYQLINLPGEKKCWRISAFFLILNKKERKKKGKRGER